MLSADAAASSDDYFFGEARADEAPEPDWDVPQGEPLPEPPAPPPLPPLADAVIAALRAAGVRGMLRDPRCVVGSKPDFATATIVQVKLADSALTTMLRAQAALAGFTLKEGRTGCILYVSRPPSTLAERVGFDLVAYDFTPDQDFHLYDLRRTPGEAPDFATATTVRVRMTAHTLAARGRVYLMDLARAALRTYALAPGDSQLEVLVSDTPM